MNSRALSNINIISDKLLPPPSEVMQRLPLVADERQKILDYRYTLENVLDGTDPRLFVVVGPCSIHDPTAALEYANRLKDLADSVQETLVLVMRVYFEKPRTVSGWKGLINDPDLDDSFDIEKGLCLSRELLLKISDIGLPSATEALVPIMPQYFGDLISWTAIGARTTESQTHREMASGLSTPVGFKNGTDGSVSVAINAICSSAIPHRFLGINPQGQCSVFHTRGNRYGHLVLRGGKLPNFDAESIAQVEAQLKSNGLPLNLVVDCSHGNSQKDHRRQPSVFANCIEQVVNGNRSIVGLMLESHLNEGKQDVPEDLKDLRYGVSITDACIDWEATERCLIEAHKALLPLMEARTRQREEILQPC